MKSLRLEDEIQKIVDAHAEFITTHKDIERLVVFTTSDRSMMYLAIEALILRRENEAYSKALLIVTKAWYEGDGFPWVIDALEDLKSVRPDSGTTQGEKMNSTCPHCGQAVGDQMSHRCQK